MIDYLKLLNVFANTIGIQTISHFKQYLIQ